jgi:hypothetical protein
MKKMRTKDMIMLGIIVGVGFFLIGGMVSSVFPGDDDNLVPYKASSAIKLIGLGILTTTFIIGGIVANDINKYFKLTILIIGLVMLLVFTIAAQFMKWDMVTTYSGSIFSGSISSSQATSSAYQSRPTPGFELIVAFFAIIAALIIGKIKRWRQ